MYHDIEWTITMVDGKIASVSTDFSGAANLFSELKKVPYRSVCEIHCRKISTKELFEISDNVRWEDLRLFGTKFRVMVWKRLFDLTHSDGNTENPAPALVSYSDFAESIGKGPGVRAVAHAIGQNPIPVIIPCHLIIPKETMVRLQAMQSGNLFRWKALYTLDGNVDYGEYALGASLKHKLIGLHLSR